MRHDQKPYTAKQPFVCTECKAGACGACVDVLRAVLPKFEPLCMCQRPDHGGEPLGRQIADPFDGSVHGPGAVVTEEGEVYVEPGWKQRFREQFGDM